MTNHSIIASSVDGYLRVFDIRMMKMRSFGKFEAINAGHVIVDEVGVEHDTQCVLC